MKYYIQLIPTVMFLIFFVSCRQKQKQEKSTNEFSGSKSCIECHDKFYKLWSTSHHGKAMQPVNKLFLANEKFPDSEEIALEGKTYRVLTKDSALVMVEKSSEPEKTYDLIWALGGKNVYYFLTPLEKGKLQTIPLAFDINTKTWYNNPQSAVRHFPEGTPDAALPWKDRMYTFNTSCYSCHVSQLNNNFDLESDSYHSLWKEPGINCETCHGPAGEHIRVCREAKDRKAPADVKLIVTKGFTQEQHNSSCAPCHAKMRAITPGYVPGEKYFDNYDLITIENTDFYPDGRDLGENYTLTGWLMNKCNQSGQLHCVMCHTSSGRNRFRDKPNDACVKCHQDKVQNVEQHSQHKTGSSGAICVNCHLPGTEFGRMKRSDHSFRPPMPEATIRFRSPNACNLCHKDKSPQWANAVVKKRSNKNYQSETLEWAQLMKEARDGNWKNKEKMYSLIQNSHTNEIVTTSFVRILNSMEDHSKWPVLLNAISHKSPLVRGAAAAGLVGNTSGEALERLVKATRDPIRLVRINAASSLAGFPKEKMDVKDTSAVAQATREYLTSILSRPDDWSSHYNLAIYYQNRGNTAQALNAYEVSAKLYPESLMPLINSSVLYSSAGNQSKAEENLRKAIGIDPGNEAANLNLGLLLAEQNKIAEAEAALKMALKANPRQAVAAYNLSVISSKRSLQEAISYAAMAAGANPSEPKYQYTLAYFMAENNQSTQAINTLRELLKKHPEYLSAVSFLGDLYLKNGARQKAIQLYEQTLKSDKIGEQDKQAITHELLQLKISN